MSNPASASSSSLLTTNHREAAPNSGLQIFLGLCQDPSPWIRGPAVTLIKNIQDAQPKEFAAKVLECKEGLRRLLEIVEDKREHIRDAALQVLVRLTEKEKNVQQFLAFEEGFARLFHIMETEGLVDGSSVVSDCLQIVNNMVRDNLMTQNLLKETSYLETHLPVLLRLPKSMLTINHDENEDIESEILHKLQHKKRALKLALQLVRFLVAELYEGIAESKLDELAKREKIRKAQEISSLQSFIGRQPRLMGAIGEVATWSSETLADIQLQALDLLQLLIDNNGGNQIVLVNLVTRQRKSVLATLMALDVNAEETPLASTASLLLDSLFRVNEAAKMSIFQHLNAPPPPPSPTRGPDGEQEVEDDEGDVEEIILSAGRVLLDALIINAERIAKPTPTMQGFRNSTIIMWKAAHRLSNLLAGTNYCKELALRIPSQYDNTEANAVAGGLLLTRCVRLLAAGTSNVSDGLTSTMSKSLFQIKVALFILLIHWCHLCPKAVGELVGSISTLTLLIENMKLQEEENKTEACQIRGLCALLLGCCLEYLHPASSEVRGAPTNVQLPPSSTPKSPTSSTLAVAGPKMTREQLLELINKRVGLEKFTDSFVRFQQSSIFMSCSRNGSIRNGVNISSRMLLKDHDEMMEEKENGSSSSTHDYLFQLYDKSFTVLYRNISDIVQKRIIRIYTGTDNEGDNHSISNEARENGGGGAVGGGNPNATSAYQDLIRIQDKQIHELQKQVEDLKCQTSASQPPSTEITTAPVSSSPSEEVNTLKKQLLEAEEHVKTLQVQLVGWEKTHKQLQDSKQDVESRLRELQLSFEQLESEHSNLRQCSMNDTGSTADDAAPSTSSSLYKHLQQVQKELEDQRIQYQSQVDTLENELEKMEIILQQEKKIFKIKELALLQEKDFFKLNHQKKEEELKRTKHLMDTLRANQGRHSTTTSTAATTAAINAADTCSSTTAATNTTTSTTMTADDATAITTVPCVSSSSLSSSASKQMEDLEIQLNEEKEHRKKMENSIAIQMKELEASRELLDQLENLSKQQKNELFETKIQPLEKELIEKTINIQKLQDKVDHLMETLKKKDVELLDLRSRRQEENEEDANANSNTSITSTTGSTMEALRVELSMERQARQVVQIELEKQIKKLEFIEQEQIKNEQAMAALQQSLEKMPFNSSQIMEEEEEQKEQEEDVEDTDSSSSSTSSRSRCSSTTSSDGSRGRDLFILLASLEIQCDVLKELLEQAKGPEAIEEAIQLSRQRGALDIL
jgi:hypothetical protein